MSALRECPICGDPRPGYGSKGIGRFAIVCEVADCQTEGPMRKGREAAIAAWNRRADDTEMEKLRDALHIAIEALDAADMPHTADAIRTALGDTP